MIDLLKNKYSGQAKQLKLLTGETCVLAFGKLWYMYQKQKNEHKIN